MFLRALLAHHTITACLWLCFCQTAKSLHLSRALSVVLLLNIMWFLRNRISTCSARVDRDLVLTCLDLSLDLCLNGHGALHMCEVEAVLDHTEVDDTFVGLLLVLDLAEQGLRIPAQSFARDVQKAFKRAGEAS